MTNYTVKYWNKNEDYWVNHQPIGEPTSVVNDYETLEGAQADAKLACDNGTAVAKIYTVSGEFVGMYANCGTMGTAWIS